MNRSSLIESLEDRQLFSVYTLSDCMVSSYRAPQTTAATTQDVNVSNSQKTPQPTSFQWGVTQSGG